jgi:hypothetical protein
MRALTGIGALGYVEGADCWNVSRLGRWVRARARSAHRVRAIRAGGAAGPQRGDGVVVRRGCYSRSQRWHSGRGPR